MDRIKSAFLGLTLLLGSWLILHTINPDLTTFREIKFDPGVVKQPSPLDLKGLEAAAEPCKFGIYFEGTHFDERDDAYIIKLNTTIDLGFDDDVQSIIMCKPVKEQPTKPSREDKWCQAQSKFVGQGNFIEGGSCMLQLFDGGVADIGCGGPEFNVIGTNSNINRVFDTEEIECIRLIEIGQI